MKIFVAYGYNERDKWIERMVFPLIKAFGSEVETGEETYEGDIPEAVLKKIRRSDALMGFTTLREPETAGSTLTHRWVIEEIAAAKTLKKKFVEIREKGVDAQGGITLAHQRITYDEKARDECLVKIVQALGVWQSTNLIRVQLLPEGIRSDLQPLLNDAGLSCSYRVKSGGFTDDDIAAKIEGIKGGLFIDVPQLKPEELIQIKIKHGNRTWTSDYESLSSYGINLR